MRLELIVLNSGSLVLLWDRSLEALQHNTKDGDGHNGAQYS